MNRPSSETVPSQSPSPQPVLKPTEGLEIDIAPPISVPQITARGASWTASSPA